MTPEEEEERGKETALLVAPARPQLTETAESIAAGPGRAIETKGEKATIIGVDEMTVSVLLHGATKVAGAAAPLGTSSAVPKAPSRTVSRP